MKKKEHKRGTEKKENQSSWKNQLLEGFFEIGMYFIVFGIAFLLVILIPSNLIQDVPFEIFMIIAFFIFAFMVGIILSVIHIVKTRNKTKELKWIQNHFKGKYDLVLMTLTKKFTNEDVYLLRGRTPDGKFDLCKETDGFLFLTEYSFGPIEEITKQFQLQSIDEAILYIENFMQGNLMSN